MRICLICGKDHEKGTPCILTGIDPIWEGRLNIQRAEEIEENAQESYNVEQLRKKRGRPSGKDRKE